MQTVYEAATRRRKPFLIAIPIAVLAFAAVAPHIPAFYGMRGDYRAFVAFHRYLDSGRDGDAFALIAPEMQAQMDYSEFKSRAHAVRDRLGRIKGIQVTQIKSHGSNIRRISTLDATILYERGSLDFECTMLSDHGTWRVWDYEQKQSAR